MIVKSNSVQKALTCFNDPDMHSCNADRNSTVPRTILNQNIRYSINHLNFAHAINTATVV